MNSSAAERVHDPSLSFIQWRIHGRGPGGPAYPLILLGDRPYLKAWIRHCYLPPKLLQYVAYAVTLRSHDRAEAGGHKLEHILQLKVH